MPTKLGQNFLVNKEIVKKIVAAANVQAADLVLEIGPGKGILTEELVKKAGKVVAIEIDKNLVASLKNKFKNQKNVEIVEGDILKISNFQFLISNQTPISSDLVSNPQVASETELRGRQISNSKIKNTRYKVPDTEYKVIANIPYYITAPIIRKFLEAEFPPKEMILMVQKEVAERICENPGKMSILAVAVQYYAQPEILFAVARENFDPAPEVDSGVIRITPYLNSLPIKGEGDLDKKFFRIVRAGFAAKRKTLINNLTNSLHLDKEDVAEKIISAGLKPTTRAQELSVADWKKLAELF